MQIDMKPIIMVYVRCSSHRARGRLFDFLGATRENHPNGFWHPSRNSYHGVYSIPETMLADAKDIKGITKSLYQDDWLNCW